MKQAMNALKKPSLEAKTVALDDVPPLKIDRKSTYDLKENDFSKNFIVPLCCNPLPGDDVFGFITDKEEVEVHKRSCQTGMKLKSNYGGRIIPVEWGDYRQYSFLATIAFSGIDRVGILNNILTKISEEVAVNIQGMSVGSKDGIFEG
ncbi:MAG TPA: GTP pyrophosphokinase, partial [Porphyromonadaceae bacterium]|nr:GTP pyrophosphokinase [Porphyromonadaceae bacterium]